MTFDHIAKAKRAMLDLSEVQMNAVLGSLADAIEENKEQLLSANAQDLANMDESNPMYDRLKLTAERLDGIASDMRSVATLSSPVGEVLEEKTMDNGLHLKKVRVPLGTVGVIYEARPNVTFDVFALCFKSGNVCVLKGGSDAEHSNIAIVSLIHEVLCKHNVSEDILTLLPSHRSSVGTLLQAHEHIDVVIPRGSKGLIDYVREHAVVPVIETGAGVVHTYIDESADIEKAKNIIINAKTRRVSVCNALDTLLLHESLTDALPELVGELAEHSVAIYADQSSFSALEATYPAELLHHATEEHFGIEFLGYSMSIKVVPNVQSAIDHIAEYSSKHSEAVIAEDKNVIKTFFHQVDAAAVYANTSTAFTDGAQFGLGAEIGISTQKLHARGPMGLRELTSYKWIVEGNGQIRP